MRGGGFAECSPDSRRLYLPGCESISESIRPVSDLRARHPRNVTRQGGQTSREPETCDGETIYTPRYGCLRYI